ncbi:NUDIX hydrolase [Labrys sp. 22185]|uniref:NUDIX hydrolase n=1 Tax=Labrys sp. 22185 TaxID=3453888 RepID=UPI003F862639
MAKPRGRNQKALTSGTPLRQVAALPFRRRKGGGIEVLVLTSRQTRRFIIPKGWAEGPKTWKWAEREALEEAGILGKIKRKPIGQYRYWKRFKSHFGMVEVDVYPLKVENELESWPEETQRLRKWLSPEDAALLIDEPQLVALIRKFAR